MAVKEIPLQQAILIARSVASNVSEGFVSAFVQQIAAGDADRFISTYKPVDPKALECTVEAGQAKRWQETQKRVDQMKVSVSLEDLEAAARNPEDLRASAASRNQEVDETAKQAIIGALRAFIESPEKMQPTKRTSGTDRIRA